MIRSIDDYRKILKDVSIQRKQSDADNGRMLCGSLLRSELSIDQMATSNVTGKSRDPITKKRILLDAIDDRLLHAIFAQAKLQFAGFSDSYMDHKSATVQYLNENCKRVRAKLRRQAEST